MRMNADKSLAIQVLTGGLFLKAGFVAVNFYPNSQEIRKLKYPNRSYL